jgi:hypothetical protein
MKKVIFSILALAACQAASAQKMGISLQGGYTFQDRVDFSYGYGLIHDNAHYGGSLQYDVNPNYSIDLTYLREDTKATLYGTLLNYEYKIAMNHILLGGLRYYHFNPKVAGIGGLQAGATIFTSSDVSGSVTKFTYGIRLGVEISPSPTVGIRLQGQMLSPVQGAGGGFYFGTGGSGVSISTYSSLYLFGFTGGLIFKFGGK